MCSKHTMFPFLVLAMIAGGARYAHAFCLGSVSVDDCAVHLPGEPTNDPRVIDLLKRIAGAADLGSGTAVRSCPPSWGETRYFVLTPISKDSRVSYYYQYRQFPIKKAGGTGWSSLPPKHLRTRLGDKRVTVTFMCGEGFSCDRHDAKGFVETEGLSPYLFRKLQVAWSEVSQSEAEFDRIANNFAHDKVHAREFSSLRSYVFNKNTANRKLVSACFFKRDGYAHSELHHFEFTIGNWQDRLFTINYDYDDDGIRILFVGEWIQ